MINASANSQDIKFSASINKTNFIEGESIWITLKVTNISTFDVSVWDFMTTDGSIQLTLVNSFGDTLEYGGLMASGGFPKKPIKNLIPDDSIWIMNDLLTKFGEPEIQGSTYRSLFLPADEYQLHVEARINQILKYPSKQHKNQSHVINFSVKAPEGEEKIVRKIFLDGIQGFIKKDNDRGTTRYREILNRHPKSVYVSRAVGELHATYSVVFNQQDKANDLLNSFVKGYPDDGAAYLFLPIMISKLKDDEERKDFYEQIKENNPRSLQTLICEKLISENRYFQKVEK